MHEDVCFVSAAKPARETKGRELSPVEVGGALLETNQEISAYVTMLGDGNTTGPTRANGQLLDPLMDWCLTYPANFLGHPAGALRRASAGLRRRADRRRHEGRGRWDPGRLLISETG